MITAEDRIQALRQLGYTQREAGFLCLAALHSGYFLRRQYCRFIGLVSGRPDDNLVEKLLARGHAREISTTRGTLLYHLCSRSFYRAIGEEDNRHRRPRPQFAIRHKLMAFDYVLDHRGRYLANEEEKIDFFHRQCGIGMDSLPVKAYGSQGSESPALRYFVDKFPISILSDSSSSPPLVSFSYVDEGEIATPAFATFLRQYQRLMTALDRCRVVFVATRDQRVFEARKTFGRIFSPTEHCMKAGKGQEPKPEPLFDFTCRSPFIPEFRPSFLPFDYDLLETAESSDPSECTID